MGLESLVAPKANSASKAGKSIMDILGLLVNTNQE
jgi:hypothetical protein